MLTGISGSKLDNTNSQENIFKLSLDNPKNKQQHQQQQQQQTNRLEQFFDLNGTCIKRKEEPISINVSTIKQNANNTIQPNYTNQDNKEQNNNQKSINQIADIDKIDDNNEGNEEDDEKSNELFSSCDDVLSFIIQDYLPEKKYNQTHSIKSNSNNSTNSNMNINNSNSINYNSMNPNNNSINNLVYSASAPISCYKKEPKYSPNKLTFNSMGSSLVKYATKSYKFVKHSFDK